MKDVQTRLAVMLFSSLCFLTGAYGQITPLGDAYINTAAPTTNYGAKTTLDVESTQTTYIQFNLASIPATYTSADITQATLKLYVIAVTSAGSFNVDYVNGTWAESTIDASNAPALGTTIAASVPLVTADKNQYILVDVTAAVQAWLSGTPNDGIALVANSPLSANFDSKETTTTSHPPELDIVFTGGGTLTGITTASGSGLTGGGTSGTLNLSLTNACAANQVLQWSGSAWACAAVGTGTITGVTAGTGLTGGGTSGTVTLGLAPNACAYGSAISALPFTCFPFAVLGANTFTASQTVTGNLTVNGEGGGNITASAAVSGSSYLIGSNLFAYGSYVIGNAFLGFAGNTTMTGNNNTASGVGALYSNTTGGNNTASGASALSSNTTGHDNTASGYRALTYTTGNYNTAVGSYALVANTGSSNTASGYDALSGNNTGFANTASGYAALANNITGSGNVAVGYLALSGNTAGSCAGCILGGSTAVGALALSNNTTGSNNVALGSDAGYITGDGSNITGNNNTLLGSVTELSTGSLQNATAVGAFAEVTENNAMVLGAISGTNQCTASNSCANVSVGIGTTAPAATLDVRDNGYGGNTISATTANTNESAVYGNNTATSGDANGAFFQTASPAGTAVVGVNTATTGNHYAGYFEGNVEITGTLSKGSGSFKIDHPLDPANKYLYHSFVESPDMMNIYNGVVTLDARGSVWITLPDYFEALNQEFRYQLTSMGRPQPSLYLANEISGNRFRISGGKPGGKVSWQVTGVRHDAYADAHRIEVEVEKPPQEQGRYLHPELFGAGPEQAIGYQPPPVPAKPAAKDETAHVSSPKKPAASLQ